MTREELRAKLEHYLNDSNFAQYAIVWAILDVSNELDEVSDVLADIQMTLENLVKRTGA